MLSMRVQVAEEESEHACLSLWVRRDALCRLCVYWQPCKALGREIEVEKQKTILVNGLRCKLVPRRKDGSLDTSKMQFARFTPMPKRKRRGKK
jgi:hypothetical protein